MKERTEPALWWDYVAVTDAGGSDRENTRMMRVPGGIVLRHEWWEEDRTGGGNSMVFVPIGYPRRDRQEGQECSTCARFRQCGRLGLLLRAGSLTCFAIGDAYIPASDGEE